MKIITKKAWKHKKFVSLEVRTVYDPKADAELLLQLSEGAESLPEDPKEFFILELTEHIKYELDFINSRIETFTLVDSYVLDYAELLGIIQQDKVLDEIPYLSSICAGLAYLADVRKDLLNNNVDDFTLSLLKGMFCAMSLGSARVFADNENKILAGKARTSNAVEARITEKEKLIEIVRPWKEEYELIGWTQPRIVKKISKRLSKEHGVKRQPSTIAEWFGFSKNV